MVQNHKGQNLYSYIRWSSEKQGQCTSHVRQVSQARHFALEHGLNFMEVLDSGVSAFRGANATQGALGTFIAAVEAGAIPSDSWLYVENLDRISRQTITNSQALFLKLLGLGLTIVTGIDGRIYTTQTVNANPTDLMLSILLFSRAHEESKTKSDRTNRNVIALIDRHNSGLPVNIKSAGKHPFWIDDSGSQYEPVRLHHEYSCAAKKALELFMQGWGSYRVCNYLNENYPSPPALKYKNKHGNIRAEGWSIQALRKMRDNPALFGQRVISIQNKTYTLNNYYPALISESDFIKLKNIKENNKITCNKQYNTISLLSGLNILRCAKCKGPMSFFTHRNKIRYVCETGKAQKGCLPWSMDGTIVERLLVFPLLKNYIDIQVQGMSNTDRYKYEIENLESKLLYIEGQISNYEAVIGAGINLESTIAKLRALQSQRETVTLELKKITEISALKTSREQTVEQIVDFLFDNLTKQIINDIKHPKRQELREIIRSLFSNIYLDKHDDKTYLIAFESQDDSFVVYRGDATLPPSSEAQPTYPSFLFEPSEQDISEIESIRSEINPLTIKNIGQIKLELSELNGKFWDKLKPILARFTPVLNKELKARK
ncbi:recombinase family protein [Aeromonas hydrophila]|uniref:recombinase family protein n=1 Tax=Aeromonas hydrophila TaxID=644 RepID=UPI0030CC07E2